ncbi:hypothetical protein A3C67_01595 [Candidatus Nomurabacteria bacterium RIFCSPHIGHO2_02_FULL_42_19]|uniref:HicB-like antitoxin of toxin-antitoxin system domain-containing protein n=1 Tax=Candidatus Nomurabacteria bacterium RIFCSPHIGHO2_02_FULL_42_19 TaxID=1801756 RepID=A0A1F6W2K8_9BACT|nr:MAG: hypothetical protein A3C67_01595 [Candidatus Nomurabacteria bacterium RIFCSPHIGHO2_02_FULL_42_19]
MLKNNLSFNLPVLITKQNKRFVAYTPALDVSTSGKSVKEAKKRFVELANIFLEEIFEAKTGNDVLSELGWKKVQKKWNPPEIISSQSIGLRMPVFA